MSGAEHGERVPILVGWALSDNLLRRITEADSRVRLLNHEAPPLPAPTRLWPPFPEQLLSLVPAAEVLLTLRLPPGVPESAPNLKWIHSQAAGIDYAERAPGLLDAGVVITNSSGVHAGPLGETVMGAIIALAKGFPQAMRRQSRHEWLRYTPEGVSGKSVTIIGAGRIGTAIAERCAALGMRVTGVRRLPPMNGAEDGPFERIVGPDGLMETLSLSDYVVLCAPRTRETVHMIGAAEFAAMREGARFINVARGDLADENALIAALESGRLAGAYLDVFAAEPLPESSPLWDMENVLITGHSGAGDADQDAHIVDIFLDNVRRYLDKEPLVNVYDHSRGY